PSVSGTFTPRAFAIRSNAGSGAIPRSTRTQAAISAERPIPARQCRPMPFATLSRNYRLGEGHGFTLRCRDAAIRYGERNELHSEVVGTIGLPLTAEFWDLFSFHTH